MYFIIVTVYQYHFNASAPNKLPNYLLRVYMSVCKSNLWIVYFFFKTLYRSMTDRGCRSNAFKRTIHVYFIPVAINCVTPSRFQLHPFTAHPLTWERIDSQDTDEQRRRVDAEWADPGPKAASAWVRFRLRSCPRSGRVRLVCAQSCPWFGLYFKLFQVRLSAFNWKCWMPYTG